MDRFLAAQKLTTLVARRRLDALKIVAPSLLVNTRLFFFTKDSSSISFFFKLQLERFYTTKLNYVWGA